MPVVLTVPNPILANISTKVIVRQEPPRSRTLMFQWGDGVRYQRVRFPWVSFFSMSSVAHYAFVSEHKIEDMEKLPPLFYFPFYIPNHSLSHIGDMGRICFDQLLVDKIVQGELSLQEAFWGSTYKVFPKWAMRPAPILNAPFEYQAEWIESLVKSGTKFLLK